MTIRIQVKYSTMSKCAFKRLTLNVIYYLKFVLVFYFIKYSFIVYKVTPTITIRRGKQTHIVPTREDYNTRHGAKLRAASLQVTAATSTAQQNYHITPPLGTCELNRIGSWADACENQPPKHSFNLVPQ